MTSYTGFKTNTNMWKSRVNQTYNTCSSSSSSSSTPNGPWTCFICTFLNKIKNDKCEMCDSIKGSEPVKQPINHEEKYIDIIKNENNNEVIKNQELENHITTLYKHINDMNKKFEDLKIENNELKKELLNNIETTNELQRLFQVQQNVIKKMKDDVTEITKTQQIKLEKELEVPQHILALYGQINDVNKHILSLYSIQKKSESNDKTENNQ
jgi:hypothetical protein